MKKPGKKLHTRKVYSVAFRKARVAEYESGQLTISQIIKQYGLGHYTVYRWIHQYSLYNKKGYKVVEHSESAGKRIELLEKKLAEAERLIGQKQIIIDYQTQLIKLAEETYGIDIEKNSNTPQSSK